MGDSADINFTYMQGFIESPPFPGTIIQHPLFIDRLETLLTRTTGIDAFFLPPFYRFWDGDSPASVLAAIELIASTISTINPEIIFAHSEGGAAALTAMLHRSHNVKCLILVSCSPPFDESGQRRLDVSVSGSRIPIPTLFVRGEGDLLKHLVTLAEGLVEKKHLTVYSWKGGHEVPNSSERGMWAQIAQKLVEIVNKD